MQLTVKSAAGETVAGRLSPVSGSPNAILFLRLPSLDAATEYAVHGQATLDGMALDLDWSFTTQDVKPLTVTTPVGVHRDRHTHLRFRFHERAVRSALFQGDST